MASCRGGHRDGGALRAVAVDGWCRRGRSLRRHAGRCRADTRCRCGDEEIVAGIAFQAAAMAAVVWVMGRSDGGGEPADRLFRPITRARRQCLDSPPARTGGG